MTDDHKGSFWTCETQFFGWRGDNFFLFLSYKNLDTTPFCDIIADVRVMEHVNKTCPRIELLCAKSGGRPKMPQGGVQQRPITRKVAASSIFLGFFRFY